MHVHCVECDYNYLIIDNIEMDTSFIMYLAGWILDGVAITCLIYIDRKIYTSYPECRVLIMILVCAKIISVALMFIYSYEYTCGFGSRHDD
jgi:hypothetical protein